MHRTGRQLVCFKTLSGEEKKYVEIAKSQKPTRRCDTRSSFYKQFDLWELKYGFLGLHILNFSVLICGYVG